MAEVQEKMKYISANILEKGYNPEDLSNFVIKKTGKPVESISFDQLKKLIEQFKDQSLQETYKNLDESQEEPKEQQQEEFQNPLYSPMVYNIKTVAQQDNELLKLENEKKKITIIISDPKKEKSVGMFSKKRVYSYKVECPEIKTEVRRTYADFEWLKNQLGLYYALRIVPPLIKESMLYQLEIVSKKDTEEVVEQAKIKHLNYFISALLKRKIFRTSAILFEFLELNEKDLKVYKDQLNKYKYNLTYTLENLKTVKNTMKFELKPSEINTANLLGKKCNIISDIYNKIEKNVINVSNDFLNLEMHMKEIGELFNKLVTQIKNDENAKKMEDVFTKLNKIFTSWSVSCEKQSSFFKNNFKSFFNYMNLEIQEMNVINQQFVAYKKDYEDFSAKLNKRKEDLFVQKDQSKWAVEPGTEDQIPKYVNNKLYFVFNLLLLKEVLFLTSFKLLFLIFSFELSKFKLFLSFDLTLTKFLLVK